MRGRTVVITGGTSGIGEAAALELARRGARIVLVARNTSRAADTLARLRGVNGQAVHDVVQADLLRMSDVRRAAETIALRESRIDVLINNAGAIFGRRRLTDDGLEQTFALNHMAPFVLTEALKARIIESRTRLICTGSQWHQMALFQDLDPRGGGRWSPVRAYALSKLCNVLWSRELARQLEPAGVTSNCAHPGFVASRFGSEVGGWWGLLARLAHPFGAKPEAGAAGLIHLASSDAVARRTGGYWDGDTQVRASAEANDRNGRELWMLSAAIAAETR